MSLTDEAYKPAGPEWSKSNLRFDFDREHELAAAVLLMLDRADGLSHRLTRRRGTAAIRTRANYRGREFAGRW